MLVLALLEKRNGASDALDEGKLLNSRRNEEEEEEELYFFEREKMRRENGFRDFLVRACNFFDSIANKSRS